MRKVFNIIALLLLLSSCSLLPGRSSDKIAVARVNDAYLYRDDLAGVVPAGTASQDSTDLVKTFINNWIRQQLLLQQAENNLSSDKTDFTKELEQYRNSLIIYQYESELVRQKLDTVVSPGEIAEYYAAHQANFQLRENIVKAAYVIIPVNSPVIGRMRNLLRSESNKDHEALESLCQEHADNFRLDLESWMPFSDLQKAVPLSAGDQEDFLSANRYFEVQDSTSRYLVRIFEYKTKESVSPLSFETSNIRSVILNKRRFELLSRLEEDLFKDALSKKKFEIY
ncbi:MAG TPA: hypothetical protein PLP88_00710 [Bacteroidales bacterium]|nr:hypothetical protein [Bacteroidales bacterium]